MLVRTTWRAGLAKSVVAAILREQRRLTSSGHQLTARGRRQLVDRASALYARGLATQAARSMETHYGRRFDSYAATLSSRAQAQLEASVAGSFAALLPADALVAVSMMVKHMGLAGTEPKEQAEVVSGLWLENRLRYEDIVGASQATGRHAFEHLDVGLPVPPFDSYSFLLFLVDGSICFLSRAEGDFGFRHVICFPLVGYKPPNQCLKTHYGTLTGEVEIDELLEVRRDTSAGSDTFINARIIAGAVAGRAQDGIETARYTAVGTED